MRNLFTLITITASLALSSVVFAGPAATGAGPASTATAHSAKDNPKRTTCRDSWKAQATHAGSKKDFMHACMSKP